MNCAGHHSMMESAEVIVAPEPICFMAEVAGSTVGMRKFVQTTETGNTINFGSTAAYRTRLDTYAPVLDLLYSTDGETWLPFTVGAANNTSVSGTLVTLANVGDKVWIKAGPLNNSFLSGKTETGASRVYGNMFALTGRVVCSGNVASLLNSARIASPGIVESFVFARLFHNCTALTSASALSLMPISGNSWYFGMFYGCTSLTAAPALPATTLAERCYNSMFRGCTSLTAAPALPATTLAERCYASMFYGCTSLTAAPALPATTLATYCYNSMFYGCTSLTDISAAFSGILAVTRMAEHSCDYIFAGCASLTVLDMAGWANPAGYATPLSHAFADCTGLAEVRLPGAMQVSGLYSNPNALFQGCSSLSRVYILDTSLGSAVGSYTDNSRLSGQITKNLRSSSVSTDNNLYNWLSGVSSTGTVHVTTAVGVVDGVRRNIADYWNSLPYRNDSSIPSGWSIIADITGE